jgi:hypothetical protein
MLNRTLFRHRRHICQFIHAYSHLNAS